MASIIRGSDGFDSDIHQGIGVNQTWQDVTASRSAGVTYTNNTVKPILVAVTFTGLSAADTVVVNIDGTDYSAINMGGTTSGNFALPVTVIVPNNSGYTVFCTGGVLQAWMELR